MFPHRSIYISRLEKNQTTASFQIEIKVHLTFCIVRQRVQFSQNFIQTNDILCIAFLLFTVQAVEKLWHSTKRDKIRLFFQCYYQKFLPSLDMKFLKTNDKLNDMTKNKGAHTDTYVVAMKFNYNFICSFRFVNN